MVRDVIVFRFILGFLLFSCFEFVRSEKCYFTFLEKHDWEEASKICESQNATLAIIRNISDQYYLSKYLDSRYPDVSDSKSDDDRFWTSAKFSTDKNRYCWADKRCQQPGDYDRWLPGEPDEPKDPDDVKKDPLCMAIVLKSDSKAWHWSEDFCRKYKFFLCEKECF